MFCHPRNAFSSIVLSACLFGNAVACDTYPLNDAEQRYLEGLKLQLTMPQSKFADTYKSGDGRKVEPACWLRDDFNNDGVDDFVGMYHYDGDDVRASGWVIDLLIVYSDAGQLRHLVVPFAGQLSREAGELRHFIALQPAGRVELRPGSVDLEQSAIVTYRDGEPAVLYFWNGKQFTHRSFFIDD